MQRDVCRHGTQAKTQKQVCREHTNLKSFKMSLLRFEQIQTTTQIWFTSLSLFEAQRDGGPSTPIFQKLRPSCLMRAYPSADILSLDRPLTAPKEQAMQRISLHTRANAVKLSE